MRVLVTGGAGFIGSNLVDVLLDAGHEAGVVDDLSTGSADNLPPGVWFREMDILSPELASAFEEFGPDAVVHLAAQVSVAESVKDPERDRAVNVDGTRLAARAAAEAGARRVLSASSAAVYGEPQVLPLPESAPKAPCNPYGASKLLAESVLAEELRPRNVDFASLRFSNVFGPRQDWRGEGGVVAVFAGRMAAGETPTIFGTGEQTRDFIYVGDVVSAIMAALDSKTALAGEDVPDAWAYNISTGKELSVEALATRMRVAARYFGPIEKLPARECDVFRSALDADKARRTFGWQASVPIEEGLAETLRWMAQRG